jgi:hypothetical protein
MNWANDNKICGKSKENKAHAAEQFFPIFSWTSTNTNRRKCNRKSKHLQTSWCME